MRVGDVPDDVRTAIGIVVAVVALVLLAGNASAAPDGISGCQPITDPGTYVLTGDVDDGGYGYCIDVRTSDVVIDGNGYTLNNSQTGETRTAIQVSGQYDGGTNVTVRNVTLTNWNKALYFQGEPEVTVSNVHVDGAHTGIDAVGTLDVSSSSFVDVTSRGISASQGTESTIRNVTIVSDSGGMLLGGPVLVEDSDVTAGSGDTGVTILGDSDYQSTFDATVRNTTVSAGWTGIRVSAGVNATLHNNTVVGGNWAGIAIDYDSFSGDGPVTATVDENTIEDAEVGVLVEATNRTEMAETTIVGNDISNGTVGVQINRGRYGTDSYYDPQWSADVNLVYEVRDNVIRTVEPDGPEDQGVRIEGAVGTVVGNDVHSTWDAISLHEADVTLRENVVRAEKRYGVGVRMGSMVTLDGDSIRAEPPVDVTDSSLATTDVDIDANGSVYAGVGATNSTVTVTGGTIANGWGAFAAVTGNSQYITDREPSVVTVEGVTVTNVTNTTVIEGSSLSINDSTFRGESTEGFITATNGTLSLTNVSIEPGAGKGMTTAVRGESGSDVTVSGSTILGAETGVLVLDSNGTIENSEIGNASDHAINATDATVTVVDNVVYNSSVNEIRTFDGAIDLVNSTGTVARNEVDSNRDGINVHDSNVSVSGNSVTAILYSVNFDDSNGTIANNTLDDGMYIENSYADVPRSVLVEDNDIHEDGFGSGISLARNVRGTVRNNTVTANRIGVRTFIARGANITGNSITIDSTSYPEAAGVFLEESPTTPDPSEVEPIFVVGNEFSGPTGVRLGDQYDQEIHSAREYVITANDFSATGTVVYNLNETAFSVPLNHYGPRGPIDHEFVGPVEDVEPFLTGPAPDLGTDVDAYLDLQTFAYGLDLEAGRVYAVGTPARLETNLSEAFGDFDGAVYVYDETTQSWTLATGDEVLGPMEAVVVVPETDVRVVFDFADATPARPTERQVSEGWNFVAPRTYDGAEGAFSTETAPLTDLLDVHTHPAGQPNAPATDFGSHYSFGSEATGPRVSPFAGYFVYATDEGTIPGTVPTGVTYWKAVQLLEQGV